ncbi:MAG: hypothetical protein ABIF01_01510 [Candidatus Micrarchaeota archaeon]
MLVSNKNDHDDPLACAFRNLGLAVETFEKDRNGTIFLEIAATKWLTDGMLSGYRDAVGKRARKATSNVTSSIYRTETEHLKATHRLAANAAKSVGCEEETLWELFEAKRIGGEILRPSPDTEQLWVDKNDVKRLRGLNRNPNKETRGYNNPIFYEIRGIENPGEMIEAAVLALERDRITNSGFAQIAKTAPGAVGKKKTEIRDNLDSKRSEHEMEDNQAVRWMLELEIRMLEHILGLLNQP